MPTPDGCEFSPGSRVSSDSNVDMSPDAKSRDKANTETKSTMSYKRAVVYRSAMRTNERLSRVDTLTFSGDGSEGAQDSSVFVCPGSGNASKPFMGFGGSFTEASAVVFYKMSKAKQEEILSAYFDKSLGIGYELGRISIASCDFGLGNWTCGDLQEDDQTLEGFSIEHYEKQILPLIFRAQRLKGGPITMLASPWSPPPWMKTKRQFHGDAHLKLDCAATWAFHYAKFVRAMRGAGLEIWGVSVQNEPEAAQRWESCIYTAAEERDFVRDHLGPTLAAEGLDDVKILIWDHNRDGMFERAAVAYSDPEASKYIWGLAFHWYGDARFETWPERFELKFEDRQRDGARVTELRARAGFDNVRRVADLRPEKHLLFTEGCQELGGRALKEVLGVWKYGERYGMNIINDLNGGTEGWIDWNIILDEHGGPNHVGNYCLAPIICDTSKDEVLIQPPYWYLGHFSKFIKPGASRLICSTSRDVLESLAYMNIDGTIAVVIMNQSEEPVEFWLKVGGFGATLALAAPRSITTFHIDDKEEGVDPVMYGATTSRVALQSTSGAFLKITDGNPEHGALVQTSDEWSGWETFQCFEHAGKPGCYLRSFHNTWLSVNSSGKVTATKKPLPSAHFIMERRAKGFALRNVELGVYLANPQHTGEEPVGTSGASGATIYEVHRIGASACSDR